ncbi:MAG: hypothetical protein AAFW97_04815 [Pseudomonadota bacterium]
MPGRYRIQNTGSMASPWRRRRMCVIHGDAPAPAALDSVSGRGAIIRSNMNAECGARVTLAHPSAGEIAAEVHAVSDSGIELRFAGDEDAVAFALTAIASDMTRSS